MTVVTQAELDRFLAIVDADRRAWPDEIGRELIELEPNERDWIVLAAVHLNARLAEYGEDRRRTEESAGDVQPATEDAGKLRRERETFEP